MSRRGGTRVAGADGRALFVGGTSSNAGKSWMVTAICAWLRQRGVSVAPFKAQNMSNNSYPCAAGGEIGRAQVAQAEACGLEPEPAMNPILLKPTGNGRSQVVVNGHVWKTLAAREYYAAADELRPVVAAAYADLARRFEVIVVEGAGSVSELNLREHDLVNLGLVTRLAIPWIVVADIERGGVFGSLLGTVQLLTGDERRLFRGFAVNKFRGDTSLFDDGVRILERRAQAPCLGVFPFLSGVHVDAEDSLALDLGRRTVPPAGARTAIVRLPHVSNATDFRLLTWADWIEAPPAGGYDFVIVPGTKNTIDDLAWLHGSGLAEWITAQHGAGATVVGICGGFQMLGRRVADPEAVESSTASIDGLSLLPVETVLTRNKRTRVVRATTAHGASFGAYMIHAGRTSPIWPGTMKPFATLDDGSVDGARQERVIGTYLHGAFESRELCREIFRVARLEDARDGCYLKLAEWFDAHVRHVDRLGLPIMKGTVAR
jgi:adenosylcobyric acid synthase